MSRTVNSVKNIVTSYANQLLMLLLNFVVRTALIRYLGEEYLGINGLFTNILSLLSLAELGVGTAISFKLYGLLEKDDKRKIRIYMKMYKTIYTAIGGIIVFLGILIVPFLKHIINDYEKVAGMGINVSFVFLLYVFNSAATYWFMAYKQVIVKAAQKTYKLTTWGYGIFIASSVAQILVLKFTKNFILYTTVIIVFNILLNLVYARIASKLYPYINEKTSEHITKKEAIGLFKDCGALLLYKINSAVINASDNIVLSAVKGIHIVGLYSNYTVILLSAKGLFLRFFESIEASIGSIHATGNLSWKQNVFKTVNFISVWIHTVGAVGIAVLCDELMQVWLGDRFILDTFVYNNETYTLPIRYLAAAELYLAGFEGFLAKFRTSFGLFQQLKFRPIISMTTNLIITIILVPFMGVAGAMIGTLVASLTIFMIDPLVIHKHELKCSPLRYFLMNVIYTVVAFFAVVASEALCKLTPYGTWGTLVLHGAICVVVSSALFLGVFCRTYACKTLAQTIKDVIKKRK